MARIAKRAPGAAAALAVVLLCGGCGGSSGSHPASTPRVDPHLLVLAPADLPGPYRVEDEGSGGGFEGAPADLAAAYRATGTFPWFTGATYRPLSLGRQPSSVRTALPDASAAGQVYRHAASLAGFFFGSRRATRTAEVSIGDEGGAFQTTGLNGVGQPARAQVVVWRSANVVGLVAVVGGDAALTRAFAQRQQDRIERATAGKAIAVPPMQTTAPPATNPRQVPSYRPLVLTTHDGKPVTIDRKGTWTLPLLGAGGPISIAPGHGVSLAFRLADSLPNRAVLHLHVRIDIAPDAGPGDELDFVGNIDGMTMISSRLNAARDPHTGKLHFAGDNVAETTSRRIELTSERAFHTGQLSHGPHQLQLRLDPALSGTLRVIRAVVLPDSAIVIP